jgi:hypothetical protein
MDFISKNKIGGLAALFLVVLLSQSQVFNFLIDTVLGRSLLLLFILLISYTNKILGTVVVFIIIIIFSSHSFGIEGFSDNTTTTKRETETVTTVVSNPMDASGSTTSSLSQPSTSSLSQPVASSLSQPVASSLAQPTASSLSQPSASSLAQPTASSLAQPAATASSSALPSSITLSPVLPATEGFDIVSKERYIQKGKQSNQIPVNDSIRNTTNVLPYETGLLTAY